MEFESGVVRPVDSIQRGWDIIKDDYWTFFLMTLVAIVILVAASVVLGLINQGITTAIAAVAGVATVNAGDAGKVTASLLPQLIGLFIGIFTNIIVTTVSGALFCGIYSALSRKSNQGVAEFGDLFSGFQKIQACLIVAVVMSLVGFVIGLVTLLGGAAVGISALGLGVLTKNGQFDPAALSGIFLVVFLFLLASIVVNLIISALTSFIYPLVADRNLSGGQAILLSIKSGLANIGGMILLLILLGLMGIVGFMVCGVGLLFVAPVLSASLFAAYQSVWGRPGGNYYPPQPPNFGQQPGY
jgi:hypothetical protein